VRRAAGVRRSTRLADAHHPMPATFMLVFLHFLFHIVSKLPFWCARHLRFGQTFQLMPTAQGSWYIHNDLFRLNYA
jgi:hypothetical protein